MKTLYVVDGHAQIFRAYYAPFSAALSSPDGEPTKATFLFTQVLLNLLRDQKPDYLAVALDYGDDSTERKAFYPEYKANRDAAPEDLAPQVQRIVEILGVLGIPAFSIRGQEADDIIASIVERLAGEDIEVWIVSRDKDLHQLLTTKVRLWDPQKPDLVLDPETLRETKGYTPEQAVEIQTLTGDSTDNVPGVPGIGPKKALALIEKYGSVQEVVRNSSELTPKMRENVEAHGERFDLTRRLVTLRRDVDLDFRLDDCAVERIRFEAARPLFDLLDFRRLFGQLEALSEGIGSKSDATAPEAREGYHLVDSAERLDEFLALLAVQSRIAIDTETTGLHAVDCDLVGVSISWKTGEGWYLPLRSNTGPTLDLESTLDRLRPILEDAGVEKVGQNIKFDRIVLAQAGIELHGTVFDCMVASYLCDSSRPSHGMDALAAELLGVRTIPIASLIGKGKQQKSMLDAPLDQLATYAAEDADITWQLAEKLSPLIEAAPYRDLFHDVEMQLVEVLANMERRGVLLDTGVLAELRDELRVRAGELRADIWEIAGREFTVDSPKQLAEVLFDDLGLPVIKKTKTGRSTDASVLETLARDMVHPLPKRLLEYREVQKLLNTYVEEDKLPAFISERTGRLHASFHQTVTATGRLSSSDPNLQNIPIRTEQGRRIRRAFVASAPDRSLLAADYSQIELRILAHLSNDAALIEAFCSGQDIHAFVAAQIAGCDPAEVTETQRSRAKAVNFGIIYGQGAFGLARSLGISRAEASEFIDDYKRRYPGIVSFLEECVLEADETGYVTTMLGRQRKIPEIRSKSSGTRSQGERLAINTVVQGSAADMIKVAMLRIGQSIRGGELSDCDLLIQVHDELVLEVPTDRADEVSEVVRDLMVSALPLSVPVSVDLGHGPSWFDAK